MTLISLLLIAIGLAMDSFAVSISTGIVLKRIHLIAMGKISILFAISQGLMPIIGWLVGQSFEDYIKAYDHWLAFILLCTIGGRMVYESFKNVTDTASLNPYSFRSMAVLAFATSIDALAVGISFSMLDVEILFPAFIIGIITLIFSILGLTIGIKLGASFGKRVELIGGIILIFIGLKILLEQTVFLP